MMCPGERETKARIREILRQAPGLILEAHA